MTDEEIEKIAQRVCELQEDKKVKEKRTSYRMSEIQNKYDEEVYKKFGVTGTIDSAIRTVAVYSQGQRYISRLNYEEFYNSLQIADKLYRLILGEDVFKGDNI